MSAITSSPGRSTVSFVGTITRSARTTATIEALRGRTSSDIALFAAGDDSASVTSTSSALPPFNCMSRTKFPTDVASCTKLVMRCGVETAMSTPHISLNIQ